MQNIQFFDQQWSRAAINTLGSLNFQLFDSQEMRLSNQGQTLDSKAGVGECEIICKKKKNCLLILILRLLLRQQKIQGSGRRKNLKMQEPEIPDSIVAYLPCRVSVVNVAWNMVQKHSNIFCSYIIIYYSVFRWQISFRYSVAEQVFKVFVCVGERPTFLRNLKAN